VLSTILRDYFHCSCKCKLCRVVVCQTWKRTQALKHASGAVTCVRWDDWYSACDNTIVTLWTVILVASNAWDATYCNRWSCSVGVCQSVCHAIDYSPDSATMWPLKHYWIDTCPLDCGLRLETSLSLILIKTETRFKPLNFCLIAILLYFSIIWHNMLEPPQPSSK